MVEDLLNDMSDKTWHERRAMVRRVLRIALIAMHLRALARSSDAAALTNEDQRDVLGEILAVVIERWGEPELDCGDQAYIWALSAKSEHQRSAFTWFALHASHLDAWQQPGRVLH